MPCQFQRTNTLRQQTNHHDAVLSLSQAVDFQAEQAASVELIYAVNHYEQEAGSRSGHYTLAMAPSYHTGLPVHDTTLPPNFTNYIIP